MATDVMTVTNHEVPTKETHPSDQRSYTVNDIINNNVERIMRLNMHEQVIKKAINEKDIKTLDWIIKPCIKAQKMNQELFHYAILTKDLRIVQSFINQGMITDFKTIQCALKTL